MHPETHPFLPARNLILLIGDGMGIGHLSAALAATGGSLHMARCVDLGLMQTHAADTFITDSAAAATALATGHKTRNGVVGLDARLLPHPNIREWLACRGWATGVLACCPVTEATPAAFVAHHPLRTEHEAIARAFVDAELHFFGGEGRRFFTQRSDGLHLADDLRAAGYALAEDRAAIGGLYGHDRVAVLLDEMPRYAEGRDDLLGTLLHLALHTLQRQSDGFFLVVEGSQIDWAAHCNDADYLLEELLDFDRVVGQALDFAAQNGETLVVVTADHETGSVSVPGGDLARGSVEVAFATTLHTADLVPVLAQGPGAHLFRGIYDNTRLFHHMLAAMGVGTPAGEAVGELLL
ncbi:MAG: alkaline phosphatase [Bacteroidia bacterium]